MAQSPRERLLNRLRIDLTRALKSDPTPRDLAQISRELRNVLAELDAIAAPTEDDPIEQIRADM